MKSAKKGKVERLWAKSVDQTNDNRFFHMAKLALHLFEVSQIDAAVAVGLEALEHSEILAPELVLMLTHEVGSWLNKDDRFDEAQETLAKSLELCSGESRSYWWAACMWEKGKSWEGLEHSDAALDYLAAAEVFSSLNEDDLAMATYQAAADSHLVRKDFQKTTQVLSVLLEFQREHHFFQQMV